LTTDARTSARCGANATLMIVVSRFSTSMHSPSTPSAGHRRPRALVDVSYCIV
jgi:hypothetical protein